MKIGSLFSGAGLGDLGWMMAGFEIKWQVEIEPFCRKILDLRYPETMKFWDINNLNYGVENGIIELWNGNAHSAKSGQKQTEDHIVSLAIHKEFWNGETSIENITEKLKGNGVGIRKKKSSTITAENASAVEKAILNSLQSITSSDKEIKNEKNINLKHGKLSEKINFLRNTESSVTTATTQSIITENVPIKIEKVDVITAGVPCQPASVAGKQAGTKDDRWLWPATIKVIRYFKPTWVVFENVSGLISLEQGVALESILSEMEAIGYELETFVFPAHALGANHRRERIWIVGYSGYNRSNKESGGIQQTRRDNKERKIKGGESCGSGGSKRGAEDIANAGQQHGERNSRKLETNKTKRPASKLSAQPSCERFKRYWSTEPDVGRVAHGVSNRVHRLKALGNGQVVACTAFIGQQIMEFESMRMK